MTLHEELKVRALSASFGALITSLAVTPLDVIKVRLQGQLKMNGDNSRSLMTASEACLKILRTEGWVSLYRGFLPTMAMSLPGTVVYFVGYERVRDSLEGWGGLRKEIVPLVAGSVARVFAAMTVSPLELIRTRMQFRGIEDGKLRPVVMDLVQSIRSGGFRVMWRGLQPTLWRDVPFSAIYWTVLEPSKHFITTRILQGEEVTWWQNTLVSFVCGAISGSLAAAITTPFDVAKTRQQLLLKTPAIKSSRCPSSTWHQLKQIWREDQWKGLTRGMGLRIAKVAPACAIMIGSYEFGKTLYPGGYFALSALMKTILYSDLELPRASVLRIIKNSSDGKLVQKDAKLACTKAATVFISYLTAAAQDFAGSSNQKILSAAHIIQGLEAIGFGSEFGSQLTEALENLKKQALLAKETKAASSNTVVPMSANTEAQLLDIGDEDDEGIQLPDEDF